MEAVFWSLVAVLTYIYAGYPLAVWFVGRIRGRAVQKREQRPTVSILIAAHNEEAAIARTLQNKLGLDYPRDQLEVIVVSDGSTDRTDEIVTGFASQDVVYLRQEPRNGKTAALNLAAQRATGEILVFADANSLYESTALRHMVADFTDPTVGYVTGTLAYQSSDGSMTASGCGVYMRYENFIRRCETRVGSVVGVNGGIDAVRRSLYEPMQPDDLPDLVLPLRVVKSGYRVVYEPAAMLAEHALGTPQDEYRMRVRVSLRSLWTLADMAGLLNVGRFGFFSIQLFSHKVLRYLAFVFIALLYLCTLFLWNAGAFHRAALIAQTVCFVAAFVGYHAARRGVSSRFLAMPFYFALVNCAALHAVWKFLRGERPRIWTPRLG
jgi:cellulose synthase/poly-beta-1,6-N-acetylglucosamine synthase-like glycosyltransferase